MIMEKISAVYGKQDVQQIYSLAYFQNTKP